MTDDPYPSMRALTDKLVGVLIAVLTISLPVSICCDFTFVQSSVTINKIE